MSLRHQLPCSFVTSLLAACSGAHEIEPIPPDASPPPIGVTAMCTPGGSFGCSEGAECCGSFVCRRDYCCGGDSPHLECLEAFEVPDADHRSQSPVTCAPIDRPVGAAELDGCASDADCIDGDDGRCTADVGGGCCTYHQCHSDSDCGTDEVCACGAGPVGQNRCVTAGCRRDTDCPDGLCVLSRNTGYDGGLEYQYQCASRHDACVPGQACDNAGFEGICDYDDVTSAWACLPRGSDGACALD